MVTRMTKINTLREILHYVHNDNAKTIGNGLHGRLGYIGSMSLSITQDLCPLDSFNPSNPLAPSDPQNIISIGN